MNGRAEVEREFNDLTKKIAQLESYRHQLDSLDTHGFETEAQLIRSKLHDANAVNDIAHELVELRRKIKERHAEKDQFAKVSSQHRGKAEALEHYQKVLEKKIGSLEHTLHEKEEKFQSHLKADVRLRRLDQNHHQDSSSHVEHYRKLLEQKIARLQQALKEKDVHLHDHLKTDDERLRQLDHTHQQDSSSRVEHYRKLLEQKIARLQLALKEKDVRQKEHLKTDERLREEAESHHQDSSSHVEHYRKLLEKKIAWLQSSSKQRELQLREHYQSDLRMGIYAQQKALALRYKNLVRSLHEQYERKLHTQLEKEVQQRLHDAVQEKLDGEKKRLVAGYIHSHARKLGEDRKQIALGLRQHYLHKEKELEDKYQKQVASLKQQFGGDASLLRKKLAAALDRKKSAEARLHHVQQAFSTERAQLKKQLLGLKQDEQQSLLASYQSAHEKEKASARQLYEQKERQLEAEFGRRIALIQRKFRGGGSVSVESSNDKNSSQNTPPKNSENVGLLRQELLTAWKHEKELHQNLRKVQEDFARERAALEKRFIALKNDEDHALDKRLHERVVPLTQQFQSDNISLRRANERLKKAQELFARERAHLESNLIRLKEKNKEAVEAAYASARAKERAALQQQFASDTTSLRNKLAFALKNQKDIEERFQKSRETFLKERTALQEELFQLKEKEQRTLASTSTSSAKRERSSLLRKFQTEKISLQRKLDAAYRGQKLAEEHLHDERELLLKEKAALENKLAQLKEAHEKELTAVRELSHTKVHGSLLRSSRLQAAFDRERSKLQTTIRLLQKSKRLAIWRAEQDAAAKLAARTRELDSRIGREVESVRKKTLELNGKRKELALQSKRLRAAVILQRDVLRKKLEESTVALKAQQHESHTDLGRKRAALRKFCWSLHTRVLLLEKREKALVQREVKLEETLEREHKDLHHQLEDAHEKRKKALSSARSQAMKELDLHRAELDAQFVQREKELDTKSKAVHARELALEAERLRMQKILESERGNIRKQFERMKAAVAEKAMGLQKRVTDEALTLSHQEKLIDQYREKVAARYAQRNARLTAKFTTLEQREKKVLENEAALHSEACTERAALDEKLRQAKVEERNAIGRAQSEAQQSIEEARKSFSAEFGRKVAHLKQKMHEELKAQLRVMKVKNDQDVKRDLAQKEKEIRPKLEREYLRKLKIEVAKRMAEVRKRKLELERQLVARTRQFLQ